jgi:nucleoid-associated protein YgaU
VTSKQGIPPCQHVIEGGDTFERLALAYYGFTGGAPDDDEFAVRLIASANAGVDPDDLQVGERLTIPQFHGPGA